jgi:flagellum-specific peptidoglycan hydrolase FlgJ
LHGKLLATGSPYRAAREVVNDPDRFADALTGVYATDPQYGTTLKWVMDNYRLKQYD